MILSMQPILHGLIACIFVQVLAWLYQLKVKNADVVDMAWTLGIILCVFIYLNPSNASTSNFLLVLLFPVLWYSRLLWHLIYRFDRNHEDSRYKHLRAHWQHNTQGKFLMFFLFQALLSVLFSIPAYWVLVSVALDWWQMGASMALGLMALVGVTLADYQLFKFKKLNDSSQVCDQGLWRYSRHPNYFFEWLHWFVYPIMLWHSPYFWWSLVMVALMLLFLLKLTGIPFSEQQALLKRGKAYQQYIDQTSPFIPWRPQ